MSSLNLEKAKSFFVVAELRSYLHVLVALCWLKFPLVEELCPLNFSWGFSGITGEKG